MDVNKALEFQKELKELFKKYEIPSGGAAYVNGDDVHFIEAHPGEPEPLIQTLFNVLPQVIQQLNPDASVVEYDPNQQN